jgi:hypothetical protein
MSTSVRFPQFQQRLMIGPVGPVGPVRSHRYSKSQKFNQPQKRPEEPIAKMFNMEEKALSILQFMSQTSPKHAPSAPAVFTEIQYLSRARKINPNTNSNINGMQLHVEEDEELFKLRSQLLASKKKKAIVCMMQDFQLK